MASTILSTGSASSRAATVAARTAASRSRVWLPLSYSSETGSIWWFVTQSSAARVGLMSGPTSTVSQVSSRYRMTITIPGSKA